MRVTPRLASRLASSPGVGIRVIVAVAGLLVAAPLRAADPPAQQPADAHAAPAASGSVPDPAQPATAPAPPAHAVPPRDHAAPPGGHDTAAGHEAPHGESPWVTASRLANFAILAGGLWYLLRKPTRGYLEARDEEIRGGLVRAAAMKETAARQLAEIQAKMAALPGELDALKARGAAETAAEQARIQQQADAERHRLLDQARRDMDLQVQAARRDLTQYAAALAVEVAERRVASAITDEDHRRLMGRYVEQLTGTRAQAGATHE
jgi:F-type H+-transporting ATPase subunit b